MPMEPNDPREVPFNLPSSIVKIGPDGETPLPCLTCGEDLELHQPDEEVPERMLGTCGSCHAWHLVRFNPEGSEAMIALLPSLRDLRKPGNGLP